jgi:predicted deacylase
VWPEDNPAPTARGPFWRTIDVPAPSGGYAVIERSVGERILKDARIADVRSPLGEVTGEARAPHDGTVWITRHLRVIDPGEMICAVARPVEDPPRRHRRRLEMVAA